MSTSPEVASSSNIVKYTWSSYFGWKPFNMEVANAESTIGWRINVRVCVGLQRSEAGCGI